MIPILHLFLNCFVDKLFDFLDDNQFVAVLRNEAVIVVVVAVLFKKFEIKTVEIRAGRNKSTS